MPDPIALVQHAAKRYGEGAAAVTALADVSLAVSPGEFIALMGRSGGGKTTLLNLLGAMDLPTSGSVRLDGVETAQLGDDALTRLRRRAVGFVFQSFHLLPTLTVRENVELPLLLQTAPDRGPRVRALLGAVGLAHKIAAYPWELSGGEMQRVAIARALIHRPRLIIADEPTGNLDTHSAEIVLDLLTTLSRSSDTAVVMATHSLEAAAHASRIVHLRDGRIETQA